MYKRILLKLSGEALEGKRSFGIDPDALKDIAYELIEISRKGVEIGIVVGGGNIFRGLRCGEYGFDRVVADYMGMLATVINCLALSQVIRSLGMKARVMSALEIKGVTEPFTKDLAIDCLSNKQILLFASGTGNPFFTTDTAAVLRALEINAEILLKGTKVEGVYSRDPMKDENAVFFESLDYNTFLKNRLGVLDLTAVSLAMAYNLPIIVFNMQKKGNLIKIIDEEKVGTIIKGE